MTVPQYQLPSAAFSGEFVPRCPCGKTIKNRPIRDENSAVFRGWPEMEITLDPSVNHVEDQGLFHIHVGFHRLHNLYFLQIWEFYLYIGLTPFLYLHITPGPRDFQDGMFHKNEGKSLDIRRIYRGEKMWYDIYVGRPEGGPVVTMN